MPVTWDVAVVGAGLAGLTAARELERAGRRVVVVDKGRSVGGRLATRRLGAAILDHGAQFFTQRGPAMADLVEELAAAGLLHEWCRGFEADDGHPRYVVRGGMTALAKHLARELAAVQVGVPVAEVTADDGGWQLRWPGGSARAGAVVLTPPVPQSLALLDAGGVALEPSVDRQLRELEYDRVLAALVVLDRPPAIPPPGGRQLEGSPLSFVADNAAKGVSAVPAVTAHASDRWSTDHWDDDPADALELLLEEVAPWLGEARMVEAQLKRWRLAAPRQVLPEPCLVAAGDDGHPLVLAGDAFAGPKVEGAHASGLAAAAAVAAGTAPGAGPS